MWMGLMPMLVMIESRFHEGEKKRDGDERWKKKVGRDEMEDGIYGRWEGRQPEERVDLSVTREVEAAKEEGMKEASGLEEGRWDSID